MHGVNGFCLLGVVTNINEIPEIPVNNKGSIHVPYVTAKQQLWAGVRSDVFGTTVDGTLVYPSNYPTYVNDLPYLPENNENDFVVMKPGDDPTDFFQKHSCVYLQPGRVYQWSGIKVTNPICIYGRGAIVRLLGEGPIMEVTGGDDISPSDIPFTVYDVIFDGNETVDRNVNMSVAFENKSALWFTNAWKSTVFNCTFSNFNGTALWYRDNPPPQGFEGQHSLLGCRFIKCRIGVSNSGRSEYSLANSNLFFDCQVCFNVIGGNWRQTGNQMMYSKCGYLHVKDGMWYEGSNKENPAHGAFTGNTLNHCDNGCAWPASFTLKNGSTISRLSGLYFDDDAAYPPTFTGNAMWYSGMEVMNFINDTNLKSFSFTGCTFVGPANDMESSRIAISNRVGTKVFFIGCTGNNVNVYNVTAANMTPPFGTVKTGNYPSALPGGRARGDADEMET